MHRLRAVPDVKSRFGVLDNRGSRDAPYRAASANQSVTINIPHEESEEWPPYFLRKLQESNGVKDWLIPNTTSKLALGERLVDSEHNFKTSTGRKTG